VSEALIGRSAELEALERVIELTATNGDTLVIAGEAGIGKTSLLREASRIATADGRTVLGTTGVEAESLLPYAGLHQLLRPVVESLGELPPSQRRALLTAFGVDEGPAPEPFLISLAVLSLVTCAAEVRPVTLVIDDVHWLDQPSQDALAFVARRLGRDPVLVIAGLRTGHITPFDAPEFRRLDLDGLDAASGAALVDRHGGGLDAAERAEILEQAAGNPLALVELPVAWRSATGESGVPRPRLPLTARLELAFAGRVSELPEISRDALLVAAASDSEDLGEVLGAAAAMRGEPVTVDVFDPAEVARVLTVDHLRVRFRHPLVRSAVLQSESLARRQAAYAALAKATRGDPYRRSWFRAQSIVGQDDEVADDLESNHETALRRGSAMSAIQILERSAQLTTASATRGRRLLLAAEHAFALGRADLVDRLVAAADRTDLSPLDRARMEWLREIFDDGVPGDAARILELCRIARESIATGDVDLALSLLLAAGLRCWWAETDPVARETVLEVADLIPQHADHPLLVAAIACAHPVASSDRVADALSGVVLEQVSDPDALRLYGMAAHVIGDCERTVDHLARSVTRLREQGRLALLSQVLVMPTLDHLELGEWDRAAAALAEGRRLALETGLSVWDTGTLSLSAVLAGLRGETERAHELAAEAELAAANRGLNDLLACVQLARGFGWLSAGRHPEAFDALRRLFDRADPAFHPAERVHGVMFLAEAALHVGRRDEADGVIADLQDEMAGRPCPSLERHLLYSRAVLADDADAEQRFLDALSHDLVRWPWHRARLELAYGSWLRRQRRVAESREPLRSARTVLDLIGATSWAEQAKAELRAAGERIGHVATPVHDLLSPQELQIAQLAAEGLSNREIGERLFLSPRTISTHLYRIFPKLDVTSRNQLAERLRR
jgi:DNA-binding CsgD family transcriptional regulator